MSNLNKKPSEKEKALCRLVTCEVRTSYLHIFKPQAAPGETKLKYSCTMLLDKSKDLTCMDTEGNPRTFQEAIKNAKIVGWGPKENWPPNIESPISDGDDPKYKDKEGYAGHWIIKATTNGDSAPGIEDFSGNEITNPNQFISGDYAHLRIYAYAWEYMKRAGVSFILVNIMKSRTGKPFGAKKSPGTAFTHVKKGTTSPPLNAEEDDDDMNFI